jgi:NAD+ synthase
MKNQAIIDHIVTWLKTYAEKAHVNGFVVGVSGGIDSALTSTLCAKTGLKTVVVEMPIHQPKDQVTRGSKHMDFLVNTYANVSRVAVDLTSTYDNFITTLTNSTDTQKDEETVNLTLGNTRARLRMTALYAVAGLEGLLVAGTGNKVEDFGVGFYTKYGDGGVDVSPIADLTKTQVYNLAETCGVNQLILNAPPTDGLWEDNRTDEDQIGATYAELEHAMALQETYGNEPPAAAFSNARTKEVWDIYIQRWRANQHKMNPIPVCTIPKELFS